MTICLYRCPALASKICDNLLNTIMLRIVAALTYSSHSTTILISFVVATRRLYQYKSKLIPKRDEGNTAPPSPTNKQKKRSKKDFSRQFGLLLFRLRFVDCNTHDNSRSQYHTFNTRHAVPTRLDDINTYPVQLPVLILLESRYPSRDRAAFCFISRDGRLFCFSPFIPFC